MPTPGEVIAIPRARREERGPGGSVSADSSWPDVALLTFMLALSGLTFVAALLHLGRWTPGGLGVATALAVWAARQLFVQLRAIRRPGTGAPHPGENGT
jgi:hypothetical protein